MYKYVCKIVIYPHINIHATYIDCFSGKNKIKLSGLNLTSGRLPQKTITVK